MLRRRMAGALGTLGFAAALFFGWRLFVGGAPSEPVPARAAAATPPPRRPAERKAAPEPRRGGSTGTAMVAEGEEEDIWSRRFSRAQQTLSSYLASTRYPPGSRPLSEQPDQVKPHHVGPLTLPLARRDGKLSTAKVTLRQDRLFLVGEESATLGITCDDGDGPATCAIASATAIVPPDVKDAGSHPTVPIPFSEGAGGGMTTVFQPSSQGFGGYRGPIRVELNVGVSGETGGASFDLVYTPAAPAVFTGRIHEALREGSLDLEVEIDVTAPGRYVFAARADDAEGRSFAYLSENQELPAGRQDVRLRVFGKLIRDEGARSPFKLRDLEGFRLLEDAYPDRDLMSAREGVIYTTKTYVLKDFSDAEWESEEKTRHVTELTKDVNEAKGHAEGH